MKPPDRYHLRFGPYLPPQTARGRKLFCEIRGTVTVGGYSDAPIPWPRVKKGGLPCLILCGALVKAVRRESNQAIAHHWGVSAGTVSKWRAALGVPEGNEGTRRLDREWAVARDPARTNHMNRVRAASLSPAAVEKRAAQRRGKPPHPNTLAAAVRADRHPPSRSEKFRALFRERGNWLRPDANPWTAEEDALLGTAADVDVARRLGRKVQAVYDRRAALAVPSHLVEVDGRKLLRLREAAGLSQAGLAARAGVHAALPSALERGRQRRLGRDVLARLAAALEVRPGEISTDPACRAAGTPGVTAAGPAALLGRKRWSGTTAARAAER